MNHLCDSYLPWVFIGGSLVSLVIQVGCHIRGVLHPGVLIGLNTLMFLAWMVILITWGMSITWIFAQFCPRTEFGWESN